MLVRYTTRHISPFSREETFLNRRVAMLRSAIGRAYFAHCSAEERAFILKILAASDPAQIEEIGGIAALSSLVERIRRDGYATIVRPRNDPTRSFAVPILQPGAVDRPLGAIVFFYYHSVMSEEEATGRYLGLIRGLADETGVGLIKAQEVQAAAGATQRTAGRSAEGRAGPAHEIPSALLDQPRNSATRNRA